MGMQVLNSVLECRKNKVWSSWGTGQLHGHADPFLLDASRFRLTGIQNKWEHTILRADVQWMAFSHDNSKPRFFPYCGSKFTEKGESIRGTLYKVNQTGEALKVNLSSSHTSRQGLPHC